MSIINKGTAFSDGEQLTADKLNDLVDLATFDQSATDSASTTVNTSGQIVVADSGVSTAKIAADAVTTAKIAADAVTTAKILDANVTFAKLTDVIDDDTMATATDTTIATSKSIKDYVDSTTITQTTGTAPYYGCRAFASYNGVSDTLNNGANIASVTKDSTGTYTFNFDVDMPDVNYSVVVGGTFYGQVNVAFISAYETVSKTISSFQIQAKGGGPSSATYIDQVTVDVAVFR